MLENENPVVDQDTIPEIPTEETPATEDGQVDDLGTTPNTEAGNDDGGAEGSEEIDTDEGGSATEQPEQKYRLRFNHENVDLTLAEMTAAAQKGKFFEQHEDTFATLEYVAELTGQSVKEVVENLKSTMDRVHYDNALAEAGNDAYKANQIFESKRSAARSRLEQKVNARNADNDLKTYNEKKLADEFHKYSKLMGVEKVTDIPAEVINTALEENITIYDAFLRHKYNDEKSVQKNTAKQNQNNKAAPPVINNSGEQDEFKDFARALLDA